MQISENTVQAQLTKNNGQTLSVEGVQALIEKNFMNENLEEARDLWLLSFHLAGLDLREILVAKKDEVMPGIFMAHKTKDDTIPLPLPSQAESIFEKYSGKYYALKFVEAIGIPRTRQAHERANRLKFDFNRRMEVIATHMGLKNILLFQNIKVMWNLLAREHGMELKSINFMANFTANTTSRKKLNNNLDKVADESTTFIDYIYGIEQGPLPIGESYPKKLPDGSTLLYEG